MHLRIPSLHEWVLVGAAAWYIQYCLRWLDGPFGILILIRRLAGVKISPAGGYEVLREGPLAQMFMCVYCLSFWVSFLILPVWLYAPLVLYPFASAGILLLFDALIQAMSRWR